MWSSVYNILPLRGQAGLSGQHKRFINLQVYHHRCPNSHLLHPQDQAGGYAKTIGHLEVNINLIKAEVIHFECITDHSHLNAVCFNCYFQASKVPDHMLKLQSRQRHQYIKPVACCET